MPLKMGLMLEILVLKSFIQVPIYGTLTEEKIDNLHLTETIVVEDKSEIVQQAFKIFMLIFLNPK